MERIEKSTPEGSLTLGFSPNQTDLYNFESRAIISRKLKENLE
jgi:hypothetical protein